MSANDIHPKAETALVQQAITADVKSVTVLIPAHNRAESLKKTLDIVVPSLPVEASVLVVDDHSEHGAIDVLCSTWDDRVSYLRTPRNLGVIGARNFGVSRVSSDIVIHLDDDSYFETPGTISSTIAMFRDDPRLAVIAYNIRSVTRGLSYPAHLTAFSSRTYTGCGNAWRMSAMAKSGTLYSGFWRQGEEVEHGLRVYEAGYEIRAVPHLVVVHDESPVHRNKRRHLSLEAANYLKRIVLRVPRTRVPGMLVRWLAFVARHSLRLSLWQILRELTHVERSLARAISDRAAVTNSTFRYVEELKRREALLVSNVRRSRA